MRGAMSKVRYGPLIMIHHWETSWMLYCQCCGSILQPSNILNIIRMYRFSLNWFLLIAAMIRLKASFCNWQILIRFSFFQQHLLGCRGGCRMVFILQWRPTLFSLSGVRDYLASDFLLGKVSLAICMLKWQKILSNCVYSVTNIDLIIDKKCGKHFLTVTDWLVRSVKMCTGLSPVLENIH